ncbi:5-oxoprolinase subunit PxpB [Ancylobacter pratisalsi]|uniref:5-oxoprolinase subunit PxpB n=1 Tax=Ancylobacter pratisalsi TaxID=1745854 RepID=A0A6P1YGZ4_9HYPH|nr:5-oxoprolinase subunit PxpB [Ancylobacter pratisalsi]QIB32557.1 5-oxoprolinase subunit PxpB [Ancylobacter pratisalsi]
MTGSTEPTDRRIGALARFLPVGDTAFAVEFGDRIAPEINALVHRAAAVLAEAAPEGMVETVPSFRSLLVNYDPRATSAATLQRVLGDLDLGETVQGELQRIWRIPVLYGGEAGPDLDAVASATGLSSDEVITRHSGEVYRVYVQGFLPGFAYLGDIVPELDLPRLTTPRVRVPPGSVAIAQRMTGIYPVASPGGWRLLGNTPVRLFDPTQSPPTLFAPGDGVRFVPVDAQSHAAIQRKVAEGAYVPDQEGAA